MKWIWFAVASLLLAGGVSADSPPLEVDRSRLSQYWEPDLGSGGPPPAAFLGQLLSQGISGHFHLRGRINGDGSVDEVEVVEVSPPDLDPQPFIDSVRSYRYTPGPDNADRRPVVTSFSGKFGRDPNPPSAPRLPPGG